MTGHSSGVEVDAGKGVVRLKKVGADTTIRLGRVSVKDAVVRFKFALPDAKRAANMTASAIFRSRGSSQYRIQVRVAPDRSVWLSSVRVRGGLVRRVGHEVRVRGVVMPVDGSLSVRARVSGTAPVTFRARVWVSGRAEPSGWDLKRQDIGASIKVAGSVGLRLDLLGKATRLPLRVAVDDLLVQRIDMPPQRSVRGAGRRPTVTPRPRVTLAPKPTKAPDRSGGPRISRVEAQDLGETSAQITWTLDKPATGQVEYGTSKAYGEKSTPERSFDYTTHIQSLSGLEPGTKYHFRVRSSDQSGKESISSDFTFTTIGSIDAPAPAPTPTDAPAARPDPDPDAGTHADRCSGSDSDPDPDAGTHADRCSGSDSDPDPDADPDAKADADPGTHADPDAKADADPGTHADPGNHRADHQWHQRIECHQHCDHHHLEPGRPVDWAGGVRTQFQLRLPKRRGAELPVHDPRPATRRADPRRDISLQGAFLQPGGHRIGIRRPHVPDSGSNSHTHTDPQADADPGTHADPDAKADADPGTHADPDAKADADPGTHADPDAKADADPGTHADPDAKADADPGTHADPDAKADADPGTHADPDAKADADPGTHADPDAKADADPGTHAGHDLRGGVRG